jgi:hypothetical protein
MHLSLEGIFQVKQRLTMQTLLRWTQRQPQNKYNSNNHVSCSSQK